MKIHLLSDLHLEFADFSPEVSDADVTILAGDIHLRMRGVEWAKQAFKGRVLYVPGNHEYYGGHLGKTLMKMIDAGDDRVRVLDCERVDIDGVRFLGATAWTDYTATGDLIMAQMEARERMTDFRKIRTGTEYRKVRLDDFLHRNAYSRNWLENQLAEPFDGETVVITHHAPSLASLPKREGHIDAAYANTWEAMMGAQVRYWFHGHTHQQVDYLVDGTRVIANPRGYPDEETGFQPGLVIDL